MRIAKSSAAKSSKKGVESVVSMPELMDQHCRLVQALHHQGEWFYEYCRVYEGIIRIVFHHNKSDLIISFG